MATEQSKALREAADAWTQGEWANTPRFRDVAQDRIGAANHFGQWLRNRADRMDEAEAVPPDCPDHREVQHRDGKRPWCGTCGWNRGRPAVPAAKIGEPRVSRNQRTSHDR